MSKKVCPSPKLLPGLATEQLLLKDGFGCLKSQSEVEVVVIIRHGLGGPSTVLTRGLYFVYPYETWRGWFKLVKAGVINTEKG